MAAFMVGEIKQHLFIAAGIIVVLLLAHNLRESKEDEEVRNIARVRTITILSQLDARRNGYVFTFLREARLISNQPNSSIVSLSQADLRKVNLSDADLYGADFSGAILSEADLSYANLFGAKLIIAILSKADLSRANLSGPHLGGVILVSEVNLREADLSGAHLIGANLSFANLSRAHFMRAVITEKQLKKAKSLKGATMPDGSTHP